MVSASWIGADLCGARLSGGILPYADLRGANLSYCALDNADLRHANLKATNMEAVDLGVNLMLRTSPEALNSTCMDIVHWLPGSQHKLMGACSDGRLRIWPENEEDAVEFPIHDCAITGLAIRSDGRFFAAGADDGTIFAGPIVLGRIQNGLLHALDSPTDSPQRVQGLVCFGTGRNDCVVAAWIEKKEGQQLMIWQKNTVAGWRQAGYKVCMDTMPRESSDFRILRLAGCGGSTLRIAGVNLPTRQPGLLVLDLSQATSARTAQVQDLLLPNALKNAAELELDPESFFISAGCPQAVALVVPNQAEDSGSVQLRLWCLKAFAEASADCKCLLSLLAGDCSRCCFQSSIQRLLEFAILIMVVVKMMLTRMSICQA